MNNTNIVEIKNILKRRADLKYPNCYPLLAGMPKITKNINDVCLIVQARLNSERVHQKMMRDFNGTNLFSLALDKILKSKVVPRNNFFVSVYDDVFKQIAQKKKVQVFNRSYESANNDNSLKAIYGWHDKLPFKYVIIVNACAPLLKVETIDDFVSTFLEQDEEGLFGAIKTKDYYFNQDGSLITSWPESQTIMNTKVVEVTYKAAHVLYASRMDTIKDNIFMGDFQQGIKLYEMDELECFDIDYEWQFELAKQLYRREIK